MQRPAPPPDVETAWTLTDGHAGNVRQAQALVATLGMPSLDVVLRPRAPWRWLAPRRLPGDARAFGPEFAARFARPPTLAIGCGRQAALATRLLRARGARVVQILDPRLAPSHWDLVIAPEHDGLRGGNVVTLLGSLHPVDDDWLAAARTRFASLAQHSAPRTALLLGGASAHGGLDAAGFDRLGAALEAQARAEGGSVLATASRRTPDAVRVGMRARFATPRDVVWADDRDGPNPYPGLLAWADRIVCSADSVNMLSEACATHAPVFVAGLEQVRGRPRRFVEQLLERGRVRRFEDGMQSFAVTPLRETARVATEVRARLGL